MAAADDLDSFPLPTLAPLPGTGGEATVSELEGVLAQAHGEADAIRAAARAEGETLAQERVVSALAALESAARALEQERARLGQVLEDDAVQLAFAIAEQALGAAVEVQPERVVDVVRGALRRVGERERVTVLVNPDDLELVRAAMPELRTQLGGMESFDVQAERRVLPGGTVVRTPGGEVDATLPTKLAAARDAVLESLRA